jgi:RNA polymerase sigma factor (sigma-70 family)
MSDTEQSKAERVAAFEKIVAEYESPLLRYATRILRSSHAAQDVVQSAFLKLLANWTGDWTPSAHLATWLYRVTHNCAVDQVRRESRREVHHQRHAEETDQTIPPDLGEASDVSDEALQAMASLRKLPMREQELVILKVFEEKSYKEISEITGLSVSNVGYILHFAMKKMAAGMRGGSPPVGDGGKES